MRKLIALVLIAACVFFANRRGLLLRQTPVADVTAHPNDFEGKRVKLHGVVEATAKLPMITQRFFLIRDGESRLPVVTYGDLPAEGKEVTVVGTLSSAAVIGGLNAGIHLTIGADSK